VYCFLLRCKDVGNGHWIEQKTWEKKRLELNSGGNHTQNTSIRNELQILGSGEKIADRKENWHKHLRRKKLWRDDANVASQAGGPTEKGQKDWGVLCNWNRSYTFLGIADDKDGEGFSYFDVKLDSSDTHRALVFEPCLYLICNKYHSKYYVQFEMLIQMLQLFWVMTRRNTVGMIRCCGISLRLSPQAS